METKDSQDSKLQIVCICSIRNLSSFEVIAQTVQPYPKPNSTESYGEAFPALGGGGAPVPGKEVVWGGANQRIKRIKPTATTITLKIPFEERRFRPGQVDVIGKGTSAEREKFRVKHFVNHNF